MFDSSKEDLAKNILFGERVKTLLFISMGKNKPISILIIKENQNINQSVLKKGIVKAISPGSGHKWQKCFNFSFTLNSNDDDWIKIENLYFISFSDILTARDFFNNDTALNRTQHLKSVYSGFGGRNKIDLELEKENETKYYKIISSI